MATNMEQATNMTYGIHHISLLVSSEQTIEFYKVLGFQEIYRKERLNDKVVLLDGYGLQLEVFIDERHPSRALDLSEPLGPRHFAIKAEDLLEKEIKRITDMCYRECGFDPQFEEIGTDWIGERYVFFRDPDGNIVELHE